MRGMRVALVILAVLLVAAPAAGAKEDVRAHIEGSLPKAARAGTTITVKWRLYTADREPFDAGELFVRLQGRGAATRADGTGGHGRYSARVKVPRGGMRGIRFGLMGYRSYPDGRSEPAPVYFPVDNDPFQWR